MTIELPRTPSFRLDGRRALITGGGRGIGLAAAAALAEAGAHVTLTARTSSEIEDAAESIRSDGGSADAIVLDMLDTAAVRNVVETTDPFDILINNAGGPPGGPLLNATVEELAQPFTRHLHAAHTLVKLLTPGMILENYGRIIQIISTSVREPIPNLGVSNTLRGAMASWAKSLSRELHPSITINKVLPGFTDTERLGSLAQSIHERTGQSIEAIHDGWMSQVPIERLIDPLETASVIAFLASPAAGAIRGVSLPVDGGRLRSI